MAQHVANLTGTLELSSKDEAALTKIYKDLKLTGRNKINKRSGKRYIEWGELTVSTNKKAEPAKVTKFSIPFVREAVVGNYEVSMQNHVQRAIDRSGEEGVTFVIKDANREEL